MASNHAENPLIASSHEEEEEDSGSSVAGSETSNDEGNEQMKPAQKIATPVSSKMHESDSEEGESESDFESDSVKTNPSLETSVTHPKATRCMMQVDGGTKKKMKKEEEMEKPNENVVNTRHCSSREMAKFFKAENPTCLGLDVSSISADWDMVPDGPKKREMEERFLKLKKSQMELVLQRIKLIKKAAKMLFKDNGSSST